MTPSETVSAFIAAIERIDIDAAIEMLADDVSYENMPMNQSSAAKVCGPHWDPFLELRPRFYGQ